MSTFGTVLAIRHQHPRLRIVLMTGLIGFSALLPLACATPPSSDGRGDSPAESPPLNIADANESAESHDEGARTALAELAQRDVEAFLKAREDSANKSSSPATDSRPGNDRLAREIAWNDPLRPDLPGRSIDGRTSSANEPLMRPAEDLPAADSDNGATTASADADAAENDDSSSEGTADDATEGAAKTLDRDHVRELVIDLSRELYRDAAHADMPLRELLLIAATTLVSPDRALSPDAIPGLTPREREVLERFQQFFADLGTKLDGSADADSIILDALDSLRRELSTEPRLELPTIALCTRVEGFGDYEAFPRYSFLAHAEQQAIVYLEIAGFMSELNSKGEWATELSQQLVIYSDRDGIPVWREDWQTAVDLSRQKRRDFFLVQLITLPKALSVGRYHLKIRVRDEKSRAEAERTISFEMVADPKLATGVN